MSRPPFKLGKNVPESQDKSFAIFNVELTTHTSNVKWDLRKEDGSEIKAAATVGNQSARGVVKAQIPPSKYVLLSEVKATVLMSIRNAAIVVQTAPRVDRPGRGRDIHPHMNHQPPATNQSPLSP